ncbi:8-oxo-dGTP diphosphatase MutT [Flammeovirga aprica]|uniref:8-oxo-dGTP diphosphatase n=1 Tax=Flammeovirga aprica JL-4 TaxID=694437 RepID=A0A7X9RXU3_9BACT|nr:8-oxo-dGTP diphosphatase MutT [Flammeovirga aprica]NME70655.1 8-oxo-dGTP diphosphatase MutT [Flammeovirga aprica JL-4]
MKPIQVVAAVIIDDQQRLLITQRPLHKSQGGLWEFPGGKVENSESNEEALVREIKEELSVTITVGEFIDSCQHDYGNIVIELIAYFSKVKEGSIQLNEHIDMQWISVEELEQYEWAPADVPIVDKIKENLETKLEIK